MAGSSGEGILNVYSDSEPYLEQQQALKNSVGFVKVTTSEQDLAVIEHYNEQTKDAEEVNIGWLDEAATSYKLDKDYYIFDHNCCTKSAEGLNELGINLIFDNYDPRVALKTAERNFEEFGFGRVEYPKGGGKEVTHKAPGLPKEVKKQKSIKFSSKNRKVSAQDFFKGSNSRGYGVIYCFVKGTKITLADGTSKNIEDISVGETVKTYNTKSKKIENNQVLKTNSSFRNDLVEISFEGSIKNINTEDHPYYVKGKGRCSFAPEKTKSMYGLEVARLEIGDICILIEGEELMEIKVTSFEQINETKVVYNLYEVDNNNNFFANGILVHNRAQ